MAGREHGRCPGVGESTGRPRAGWVDDVQDVDESVVGKLGVERQIEEAGFRPAGSVFHRESEFGPELPGPQYPDAAAPFSHEQAPVRREVEAHRLLQSARDGLHPETGSVGSGEDVGGCGVGAGVMGL